MKLRIFLFILGFISSAMSYASGSYIPRSGPGDYHPCIKDKNSKECKDKLDNGSAQNKSDTSESSKE